MYATLSRWFVIMWNMLYTVHISMYKNTNTFYKSIILSVYNSITIDLQNTGVCSTCWTVQKWSWVYIYIYLCVCACMYIWTCLCITDGYFFQYAKKANWLNFFLEIQKKKKETWKNIKSRDTERETHSEIVKQKNNDLKLNTHTNTTRICDFEQYILRKIV